MPKTVFGRDYPFLPRAELLSFGEIERIATAAVQAGVEKIRLTGGEPLLRRGIENLVEKLARLDVESTLNTNGVLLNAKAANLKRTGLGRVTVSLDGLEDAVFRRMSEVDCSVTAVLDGIDAAARAGLSPVKINFVVKRGCNEGQILPLARHFRHSGHILRFIEYMDAGGTNAWRMDQVVPSREVIDIVGSEYPLAPIEANYSGEVAEGWRDRNDRYSELRHAMAPAGRKMGMSYIGG